MAIELADLMEKARFARQLPQPEVCRALRRSAGLTQEDLADTVGVSRQAIAAYEAGDRRPRGEHLRRYVEVLRALSEVA